MNTNKHINTFPPEEFITAGYKKGSVVFHKDVCMTFQKRIRDEKGKCYFINVDVHDFSNLARCPFKYNYEFSVQWDHVDGMEGFIAKFHTRSDLPIDNLVKIEESIHKLWVKIGSPYYELY